MSVPLSGLGHAIMSSSPLSHPKCHHCVFPWHGFFLRILHGLGPRFFEIVHNRLKSAGRAFDSLKNFANLSIVKPLQGRLLPKPKRKALLVGLRYQNDNKTMTLSGPHRDVKSLRQLLIDSYGYEEENIVVMMDDAGPESKPWLVPNSLNLVREMKNLVKDAKAGDRFVFHFSGHSTQVENKRGTEEDLKDEGIITSEGFTLIDNILKDHLVKPLPVHSTLTAILDTCHSASLLDLKHHRCNRVEGPWAARENSLIEVQQHRREKNGKVCFRKKTLSMKSADMDGPSRITNTHTRTHRGSVLESAVPPLALGKHILGEPGREVCESPRVGPWEGGSDVPPLLIEQSVAVAPAPALASTGNHAHATATTDSFLCDGVDCGKEPPQEVPLVLAIGACKDAQTAFEDRQGQSMTHILVTMLRQNPHPCLECLMQGISQETYNTLRKVQEDWGDYSDKFRAAVDELYRSGKPITPEEETFIELFNECVKDSPCSKSQNPQLASHTKQDMTMRFSF